MKYNLINFCEFDKNAVKSYCAIHNETEDKNLGDITKVNIESLPECDMITHLTDYRSSHRQVSHLFLSVKV